MSNPRPLDPISQSPEGPDVIAVSIAQYARDHAVDLIVLASHGRTGFKRAVLGSVAERVVRSAPCDVLVVRSKNEIEEDR